MREFEDLQISQLQMKLKRLYEFRQNIYNQMGAAQDAVFELMEKEIFLEIPISI